MYPAAGQFAVKYKSETCCWKLGRLRGRQVLVKELAGIKELAGNKGNNAAKGGKRPASPERGGTQNSAGLGRSSRSTRDSGPCRVEAEVARYFLLLVKA